MMRVCLLFVWGAAAAAGTAAGPPSDGPLEPFLQDRPLQITTLFEHDRFPNIVVSIQGTLLAVCGRQQVRVRRSTDGGVTWEDPLTIAEQGLHAGGVTVDETTGHLLVFVEDHHPPAPLTMWRSTDDGRTWKPERPVVLPDRFGHVPSMHMNEHGITLKHGPWRGRLLRASRFYAGKNERARWPDHYTNAVYSDDGGRTWQTSDPFPEHGTGEAAVAELSDGRICCNSRVHWDARPRNTRRRSAVSRDGGQSWTDLTIVDVLPDGDQQRSYGCMGGLTRLPVAGHDILIFSNIDCPGPERENATVWASFDGGRTWPVKRLIQPGPAAYSSLTAGRPGTVTEGGIWLLGEGENGSIRVVRFSLAWLLQGTLTGDGSIPAFAKPR